MAKKFHPSWDPVHAAIIDDLGGDTILGAELGLAPQRIHNWRRNGIAHKFRPHIRSLIEAEGGKVPKDFIFAG